MHARRDVPLIAALVSVPLAAGPAAAAVIRVGSASVSPGGTAAVEVSLQADGESVAGTANTIEFEPAAQLVACTADPDAGREATTFRFQPEGCTPGSDCTSVRATALSIVNLDPIPDGAVLYSCEVAVSPDVQPGAVFPLRCTDPEAADPEGTPVPASCSDGQVTVATPPPTATGSPAPTPTATPAPPSPTATPTPVPGALPLIRVGTVEAAPGGTAEVPVVLETRSWPVAATENALEFDPLAPVLSCTRNPDIGREATAFALRPTDCEPGVDCTEVMAIVLSFTLGPPIPDGAELYRCRVAVDPGAPAGTDLAVACSAPLASDPQGTPIPAECAGGAIRVRAATATPTPTATATFTATFTPTATPTPTPTDTPTPTPTPPPCPGDCDGDGFVRVQELVRAVGAALGRPQTGCDAADGDGDGEISVEELIRAVRAALQGCPAATPP